jgi:holo-[acyl-carrier protein] synthase
MLAGLGVDIEEVKRFVPLIRNKKFLSRVFTKEEIAYCMAKKNRAQHFAVRFAAKEAVWKAISEPMARFKKGIGHKDIGVRNSKKGKPAVVLPAHLSRWQKKISISLSHTNAYAVAVAMVMG